MIYSDEAEWRRALRHDFPSVRFEDVSTHPPGVNALCEDVLVGRFYTHSTPPYGVLFDQPRSCGGR
jgi:hypothetical protein